jgi:hypothetical protein
MAVTPPETPSSLLERAAQQVFRLAFHFKDWEEAAHEDPERIGTPESWWAYDVLDRLGPTQGKRWVETMNPAIATALGCWFREKAHEVRDASTFREVVGSSAYELAILILGEPVPGEDECAVEVRGTTRSRRDRSSTSGPQS